jgi:hypothetical protein
MSAGGAPPERVVPKPFVTAGIEQLDEIKDGAGGSGHCLE